MQIQRGSPNHLAKKEGAFAARFSSALEKFPRFAVFSLNWEDSVRNPSNKKASKQRIVVAMIFCAEHGRCEDG